MFDLTKNLKDATYVLIGLGVIGYQKAGEQGKQLRARLDDQRVQLDKSVEETKTQLTKLATDLEQRFEPVREAVEGRLDTLVSQTREAALQAQATLRTRLNGTRAAA